MTIENVAVLFTDVVGSTALASSLSADAADEIWAGWGSEAGWTQRPSRLTREDQRAGVVARFPEGAGDALRRARELLEVIITVL